MISYLIGKPTIQKKDKIILAVNGVGYGVNVGSKVLKQAENEKLELYIYTHVKEDKLELYGFLTQQEESLFELILSVSGVGPKIAIALVDAGVEKLIDSVQNANVTFFSSVPRVGKKLAQKIIIELKTKLGGIKELNLAPLSKNQQDVYDALINLGFREDQITDALSELDVDKLDIKQVITLAIKKISHAEY